MSAEEVFKRFANRIVFLTCSTSGVAVSLASGVLVSDDGFVVTNGHVVEGCQSIAATYINGASRRTYDATLKYYDKRTDTAVLKLPVREFDYFDLRRSGQIRVGARVYAIGNPRGYEQSISEGIVSGIREEDSVLWIQHSAPISPGSSGGALISSQGNLLGINSYLLRDSQNLNFAVPASTLAKALSSARRITDLLKTPSPTPQNPPASPAQVRTWSDQAEEGNAQGIVALLSAAKQGNLTAQLALGLLYYNGRAVQQDYVQAIGWIREAAEKGNPEAQATLGAAYELGRGVPRDDSQAGAWYRKAAEQGNTGDIPIGGIQHRLGVMYATGTGVPQSEAQALAWYRRAAENGNSLAMIELGVAYDMGNGVAQDDSEAVSWYRKAAEQGEAIGMTLLGGKYANGKGVGQDYAQAVAWYWKAADKGEAQGMNNLGEMYESGLGVVKDVAEALASYRKSAALGNERAKANLKRLGQ